MAQRDLEDFAPGTLVRTPTGRYGIVMKLTYGADGDLPRCQVRYLDGITRDYVRLQPVALELIAPAFKVFYAINLLRHKTNDSSEEEVE